MNLNWLDISYKESKEDVTFYLFFIFIFWIPTKVDSKLWIFVV
jgi:hypothetical protein